MKLKIRISIVDYIFGCLIIYDVKLPKVVYELRQVRNSFFEEIRIKYEYKIKLGNRHSLFGAFGLTSERRPELKIAIFTLFSVERLKGFAYYKLDLCL